MKIKREGKREKRERERSEEEQRLYIPNMERTLKIASLLSSVFLLKAGFEWSELVLVKLR